MVNMDGIEKEETRATRVSVIDKSGHTVGLSGYNIIDVGRKRFYEMSHTTTIPDAVLNYDCRVQKNPDPDTGVQIRH